MDYHTPVLLEETIKLLSPDTKKIIIDATLGNAGHTIAMLQAGATVIGVDQDIDNLRLSIKRIKDLNLSKNFIPIQSSFSELNEIYFNYCPSKANGLLLDLGLSRNQITSKNRGFSFNDNQSLDMRLDPTFSTVPAQEIINNWSEDNLFQIFSKYGQEKYSRQIAHKIITERQIRPISSSSSLAELIKTVYREKKTFTQHHPATKVFLALKIYVNHEYENLNQILNQSFDILLPGSTVCVITFHSGEDRIVKQFTKTHHLKSIKILTPKPVKPSRSEINNNPLSRSALLRAYTII